MNQDVVTPAFVAAGPLSHMAFLSPHLRSSAPDKFERLAVNLSKAEIRTMVLELMG